MSCSRARTSECVRRKGRGAAKLTALTRRSPKLAPDYQKQDVRDALNTIEDRPRIPEKTPSGTSADGYDGEVCRDANYLYVYTEGTGWKRTALSTF